MSTQYYAEFVYPGLLVGETSATPIDDPSAVEMPERAVGYRTFARTATELDGERLLGEIRDRSPWTYRGCEMTLDDVRREMPDNRILILNMESNGYARVVRLPNGQFYPLDAADRVA